MKFLDLYLSNFFSFEQAHVPLSDAGLVLIKGINSDSAACGSNGSGKSSVTVDAICWSLYGQTARELKGSDVVRQGSEDGCFVAISFFDGVNTWQVVRYQDHPKMKNAIQLLRHTEGNVVNESASDPRETQAKILRLIRLPFNAARTAIVLGQNSIAFASMTDGEKKVLLEQILEFEVYVGAEKKARLRCTDLEMKISLLEASETASSQNVHSLTFRLNTLRTQSSDWEKRLSDERSRQSQSLVNKEAEIARIHEVTERLGREIEQHTQLAQVEVAAYQVAFQEWQVANNELQQLQGQYQSLLLLLNVPAIQQEQSRLIQQKSASVSRLTSLDQNRKTKLEGFSSKIQQLKTVEISSSCPACSQNLPQDRIQQAKTHVERQIADLEVEQSLFLSENEKERRERTEEIASLEQQIIATSDRLVSVQRQCQSLEEQIVGLTNQIECRRKVCATIKAKEDEQNNLICKLDSERIKIESPLSGLIRDKHQLESSLASVPENPFTVAVQSTESDLVLAQQSLQSASNQISELKTQLKIASFWIKGFGKAGIQSYLLDSIVPYLNERVAFWGEIIWQGEVQIEFRTQRELQSGLLKEDFHIAVNNVFGATTFKGMSAGEQERTNLCIALALQDLIMNRYQDQFNICILDEVCHYTDAEGAEAYHRVLIALSKIRSSVFVITHNSYLEALFTKVWTVTKQEKTSTLVAA